MRKVRSAKQKSQFTSSPVVFRPYLAPGTAPVIQKRSHIEKRKPTVNATISISISSTRAAKPELLGVASVAAAASGGGASDPPAASPLASGAEVVEPSDRALHFLIPHWITPSNRQMQRTPKKYMYGLELKTSCFKISVKASAPAKPTKCTPTMRMHCFKLSVSIFFLSRNGVRNRRMRYRRKERTSLITLASLDSEEPIIVFHPFFMTMNKRMTEKSEILEARSLHAATWSMVFEVFTM
mmetsp:Transcript_7500/g.13019  ORF Transcript_7500/g.13019 Transcript_7500/m.13019 type:complete len:240 (+) Transcript_7500:722-1441(+)